CLRHARLSLSSVYVLSRRPSPSTRFPYTTLFRSDIRLRRFSHPSQVRDSIFDRIRSERNKKVTEYDSEGQRLASNIVTTAEEQRSEEHTSELQSHLNLVCRLLLEKKKQTTGLT